MNGVPREDLDCLEKNSGSLNTWNASAEKKKRGNQSVRKITGMVRDRREIIISYPSELREKNILYKMVFC